MTPEVRDLGEEFRRAKLEEVTIDYLSRAVSDPTVVVTEDVHWMDEGSAGLLRAVADRIAELPWLVCVSRRDEETGFVLPEAPRCTSLKLAPLTEDALGSLIDLATEDAPFPRHEVAELSGRSGGNPLFLQELLHAAKSAGTVEGLPDSIEGMITAEIDRLATADRRVLRVASVLGMSFDAALVETLLEERDRPGTLSVETACAVPRRRGAGEVSVPARVDAGRGLRGPPVSAPARAPRAGGRGDPRRGARRRVRTGRAALAPLLPRAAVRGRLAVLAPGGAAGRGPVRERRRARLLPSGARGGRSAAGPGSA